MPRRAINNGTFRTLIAPMTDFDLEARSLSELKKMPQGRRQGNPHLSRSAEGGSPR